MNDKYLVNVLSYLEFFPIGIEESRLIDDILRNSKMFRENNSKDIVKEKGYDIYRKRKNSIFNILKCAYDYEYIEESVNYDNYYPYSCKPIRLSYKGLTFLKNTYTNCFCKEYLKFKEEVEQALIKNNEPALKELIIMRAFYDNKSIDDVVDIRLSENNNSVYIQTKQYQEHIFDLLGLNIKDNDYIFNFKPILFVPKELIGSKVSCKIDGIKINEDIKIFRPFPNKAYYVTGFEKDGEKVANGFYPIVAPKEDFPEELAVTINWNIINSYDDSEEVQTLKVKHNLKLKFSFKEVGNIFSTDSRHLKYDVPSFNLITFLNDRLLDKERKKNFRITHNEDIVIDEEATLYCFSIKSAMLSGVYFSKWLESEDTKFKRKYNVLGF